MWQRIEMFEDEQPVASFSISPSDGGTNVNGVWDFDADRLAMAHAMLAVVGCLCQEEPTLQRPISKLRTMLVQMRDGSE